MPCSAFSHMVSLVALPSISKAYLYTALAIATLTIFVRCVFRVAELRNGFSGKLANNQTLFMIFEGPMIMIAVVALTICHPGITFGGCSGWKSANWTWKKRESQNSMKSVHSDDISLDRNFV